MQQYAEDAVREHVTETLQPAFLKKEKEVLCSFSRLVSEEEIKGIMERSKRQSERYLKLKQANVPAAQINKIQHPCSNASVDGKTM